MFQKRIIEKYLSKIDSKTLLLKYSKYCSIFANKQKQENIRNSKEEQYPLNTDQQKKITRFISRIKETYSFEKTTQNI